MQDLVDTCRAASIAAAELGRRHGLTDSERDEVKRAARILIEVEGDVRWRTFDERFGTEKAA